MINSGTASVLKLSSVVQVSRIGMVDVQLSFWLICFCQRYLH